MESSKYQITKGHINQNSSLFNNPLKYVEYFQEILSTVKPFNNNLFYLLTTEYGTKDGNPHWQATFESSSFTCPSQSVLLKIKKRLELPNSKQNTFRASFHNTSKKSQYYLTNTLDDDDAMKWRCYALKDYLSYECFEQFYDNNIGTKILTNYSKSTLKQLWEWEASNACEFKRTPKTKYQLLIQAFEQYLSSKQETSSVLLKESPFLADFLIDYYRINEEWIDFTKFSKHKHTIIAHYYPLEVSRRMDNRWWSYEYYKVHNYGNNYGELKLEF